MAKPEERFGRDAVILQDDELLELRECPVDRGVDTNSTTQIVVGVILQDRAVPVDAGNYLPRRGAERSLLGGPRTIGRHEHCARSRLANRLQSSPRVLRA